MSFCMYVHVMHFKTCYFKKVNYLLNLKFLLFITITNKLKVCCVLLGT